MDIKITANGGDIIIDSYKNITDSSSIISTTSTYYDKINFLFSQEHVSLYLGGVIYVKEKYDSFYDSNEVLYVSDTEQPLTDVIALFKLKLESDGVIVGNTSKFSVGITYPEPTVVDNLDGTLSVYESNTNLFDNHDYSGVIRQYKIKESLNIELVDNSINYIVVDYNGGTPIYKNITDVSLIDESDVTPVLTAYREGNEIMRLNWDSLGSGLSNKLHARLVKTMRFARESGVLLSEKGVREIALTSGVVWHGAVTMVIDPFDSAVDPFRFYYHVGGVWQYTTLTQYNNTQYDDGINLVEIGNNKYTVNWFFRSQTENKIGGYVLGTSEYHNLAEAQTSQVPDLPVNIRNLGFLVGRIIVKKGENFGVVQSAFDTVFVNAPSKIQDLTLTLTTNTLLNDNNYNVLAITKDITITFHDTPTDGIIYRINNDSTGKITLSGNGNLIFDASSITLYANESVYLVFGNNKWNII